MVEKLFPSVYAVESQRVPAEATVQKHRMEESPAVFGTPLQNLPKSWIGGAGDSPAGAQAPEVLISPQEWDEYLGRLPDAGSAHHVSIQVRTRNPCVTRSVSPATLQGPQLCLRLNWSLYTGARPEDNQPALARESQASNEHRLRAARTRQATGRPLAGQ